MKFGPLFQAKVIRHGDGNSKGFGFLTFSTYEACLDAIQATNLSKWKKRTLNVRFLQQKNNSNGTGNNTNAVVTAAYNSNPQKTIKRPRPVGCSSIFVGNMSYDITMDILRKIFTPTCGEIKAIRFCEDINTKEFRGFGYVQFVEEESTEKAVAFDGTYVMGRPIRVDYDEDSKAMAANQLANVNYAPPRRRAAFIF